MESKLSSNLFTEKLRPKTLDQVVLLPRVRQELSKGVQDHILLYGSAGIGKTTLSRILASGHETLEINASLERGIDTIRDKVVAFSGVSSLLNGKEQLKIVLLEECDNLTNDAWASLRATIEKYSKTVRFVANCNYIEKIPEPIQSRFNCISILPNTNEEEQELIAAYKTRVSKLLTACHISYDEENLMTFIKSDFPDLRSLIKKIQQLVVSGATSLNVQSLSATFDHSNLFKIMMSAPDPWNNYKAICGEWANKADEGVLIIGKQFPEYFRTNASDEMMSKLPLIVIAIAEHNEQLSRVTDKLITLLSLVFKIQLIIANRL